ncbi:SPOSA6832_01454 [Sporobolomyces salmonicolor]|uniref:SPOSA6832_01454-mRNA-1:cds n=1 Tax=Sporidiobolus salmonicolor TaxID=5005 RepID=A0A0D6EIP6_SPOSA|nr:SPOSA6832_01454 [Sporobolomyces salmonicolor]
MTNKRSPSPAAEQTTAPSGPPTSKQKMEHPTDDPASTSPQEVNPTPPADEGGDDTRALVSAPDRPGESKMEENDEETTEKKRKEGVKVEELHTLAQAYADGSLQGYDDPADLVYPLSKELNDKVILWCKLEVDCIVNAANKSLLGGGGVDGAIHSAAGPALYDECKKLNGASTGETKLTGGHRLPARYIAHTVGPIYSRNKKAECEEKLRSCYRGTMELCVEKGIKSVAFSGISTGMYDSLPWLLLSHSDEVVNVNLTFNCAWCNSYGYPLDDAASVACDEVRKFLEGPDGGKIDHVIFCNFRQIDVNACTSGSRFFQASPSTRWSFRLEWHSLSRLPDLDNVPAYFPPPPTVKREDAAGEKTSDDAAPEFVSA